VIAKATEQAPASPTMQDLVRTRVNYHIASRKSRDALADTALQVATHCAPPGQQADINMAYSMVDSCVSHIIKRSGNAMAGDQVSKEVLKVVDDLNHIITRYHTPEDRSHALATLLSMYAADDSAASTSAGNYQHCSGQPGSSTRRAMPRPVDPSPMDTQVSGVRHDLDSKTSENPGKKPHAFTSGETQGGNPHGREGA